MSSQPTSRRVDRLIYLLAENATVILPGPKIAAETGVARSTVWKWVEKLRSLGVEVQGHPATGYQLRKLPDVLTPSLLRTELGDCSIGRRVIHYFTVDSTNTVAMSLAARGAAHGEIVVAEEQTAGRGRFGRFWYSQKSAGIYASVILRPRLTPSQAPALTLAAGIAAREAIKETAGIAPDIRWPNDLMMNGKKLGGILTEMSAEMDRVHWVVVGTGINVNHEIMPNELAELATSLRIETGRTVSRLSLLAGLLRQMEIFYNLLIEKGTESIARRWESVSSFARGKRVRVRRNGKEDFGTTAGMDSSGALRVEFDDGRRELLVAGEVSELK